MVFPEKKETLQVKAALDGKGYTFKGYASYFGNEDKNGDKIISTAFDDVIERINKGYEPMPLLMIEHAHKSLAIAGTYTKISRDNKGLLVEGKLFQKNYFGEMARNMIASGEIGHLSIGFTVGQDDVYFGEDNRWIFNVDRLPEISLVSNPANLKAEIFEVKNNSYKNKSIEELKREILKKLAKK